MATSSNKAPDPYAGQLPGGGASLAAWLIVGCAVLAGVVITWETRSRRQIKAQAAKVEGGVRDEFKKSIRLLRENDLRAVLARDHAIGEQLDWLTKVDPDGYRRLRAARLFIRARARIGLDDREELLKAESDFSDGLKIIRRARGQTWELGLCGRGEARFRLGRHHEALEDLDAVIAANPNFGAAYYWRSRTFAELGNAVPAEQDAERARALGSWPPRNWSARAAE